MIACWNDCGAGAAPADALSAARGVDRNSDNGRTKSSRPAKTVSAACQPAESISATASGENRNCPNEPAAVPYPNAAERHSGGTSLPNAPTTIVKAQPDRPKPIRTPAVSVTIAGVCE